MARSRSEIIIWFLSIGQAISKSGSKSEIAESPEVSRSR